MKQQGCPEFILGGAAGVSVAIRIKTKREIERSTNG